MWAGTLGIQLGQSLIPNFRVAIGDVFIGFAALLVFVEPTLRRRALSLPTPLRWTLIAIAVALLVGLVVDLVVYRSLPQAAWLNRTLGFGVIAAIPLCIFALCPSRTAITQLLGAFLLGALVTTVAGFVLWTAYWLGPASDAPPFGVRFVGLLLSPNAAGVYFALAAVVAFVASASPESVTGPKWMRIAAPLVLTVALVASLSRSAWAAGLVAFAVVALMVPRRKWVPAVAAVVLAGVLLPTLPAALGPTLEQAIQGDVSFLRRDDGVGFTVAPTPTGSLVATTSAPASPSPSAGPTTPAATARPSLVAQSHVPIPAAGRADPSSILETAGDVASDRYGANDRLIIALVALRLWWSNLGTALFGVGLEAFPILAVDTELGADTGIHMTYLHLPVEMGVAGLIALILLMSTIGLAALRTWREGDRGFAALICGAFTLFAVWWTFNDGLYQRTFWLVMGVAVAYLGSLSTARRLAEGSTN